MRSMALLTMLDQARIFGAGTDADGDAGTAADVARPSPEGRPADFTGIEVSSPF
jgi:hypothetical protein